MTEEYYRPPLKVELGSRRPNQRLDARAKGGVACAGGRRRFPCGERFDEWLYVDPDHNVPVCREVARETLVGGPEANIVLAVKSAVTIAATISREATSSLDAAVPLPPGPKPRRDGERDERTRRDSGRANDRQAQVELNRRQVLPERRKM